MQTGKMPLMGEIVVPKRKYFSAAMNRGGTGEIHSYPVPVLVFGQYLVYRNRNDFPGFVTEPESHGRNFSVCIGAGNHLHRNVYAQYAFQRFTLPSAFCCISILSHRTHVCKQGMFGKVF